MNLKNTNSLEQLITLTTPDDIKNAGFKLDENYMIALTPDNAAKALECIKGNKRYEKSSYEVYYNKLGKSLSDYSKEELKNILWCVARSNSTRSSNENISVITDWIFKNLTQFLKRLEKGDTTLVDELTTIKGLSRKEKSLSSKICSYLCELEFKQSKFAVNDTVVRRVLPYYLNYYGISNQNKALENYSYSEIIAFIDKIAVNLPPKMNYTEIDQIIWYCYRNDPVRSQIAVALA